MKQKNNGSDTYDDNTLQSIKDGGSVRSSTYPSSMMEIYSWFMMLQSVHVVYTKKYTKWSVHI